MRDTVYIKMSVTPEIYDLFKQYSASLDLSLADMTRFAVIRDAVANSFISKEEADNLWKRRKKRVKSVHKSRAKTGLNG